METLGCFESPKISKWRHLDVSFLQNLQNGNSCNWIVIITRMSLQHAHMRATCTFCIKYPIFIRGIIESLHAWGLISVVHFNIRSRRVQVHPNGVSKWRQMDIFLQNLHKKREIYKKESASLFGTSKWILQEVNQIQGNPCGDPKKLGDSRRIQLWPTVCSCMQVNCKKT